MDSQARNILLFIESYSKLFFNPRGHVTPHITISMSNQYVFDVSRRNRKDKWNFYRFTKNSLMFSLWPRSSLSFSFSRTCNLAKGLGLFSFSPLFFEIFMLSKAKSWKFKKIMASTSLHVYLRVGREREKKELWPRHNNTNRSESPWLVGSLTDEKLVCLLLRFLCFSSFLDSVGEGNRTTLFLATDVNE